MNIESIAKWSSPIRVMTKQGPRLLRKADPQSSPLGRQLKEVVASNKDKGLSWSKDPKSGAWELNWWQPDTGAAETVAASKASDSTKEFPVPPGLSYLPYQKGGIEFALNRPATLIADEMGLGKTIQGIGVINADPTIKNVLVVCPASLKLNWVREATKWLIKDGRIWTIDRVKTGKDGYPSSANFVVVNYDMVKKYHAEVTSREWDLVILDESHYLKNPKAQRTKAVVGSKEGPGIRAKRKIALTGTPILNRPIEAQPVLEWLAPQTPQFKFWSFAKKYADAHQTRFGWDFTGSSNLEELQTLLRSTVMIRRRKMDVLTELPAKRRQVIEIGANGNAKLVAREKTEFELHQEILEELREKVEMARLLEDADAYAKAVEELSAGIRVAFESMSKIRHDLSLAKIPYAVEHILDQIESGPVVVFAHHRDVVSGIVEELAKKDVPSVSVVGGMTDEAKQKSVDDFQNGKVQVFVGNIKAAGVGLTLVRSSHVIFAELDWVPGNMTQAEDRCHRIGQKSSVLVQHLVLEGSLDKTMADALVEKQAIADAALDNDIAFAKEPLLPKKVSDRIEIPPKPEAKYSDEQKRDLLQKLRYLAGMCDGAQAEDGCGFNKFDTRVGKSLAALSDLTDLQADVAARLTNKYRNQLGN